MALSKVENNKAKAAGKVPPPSYPIGGRPAPAKAEPKKEVLNSKAEEMCAGAPWRTRARRITASTSASTRETGKVWAPSLAPPKARPTLNGPEKAAGIKVEEKKVITEDPPVESITATSTSSPPSAITSKPSSEVSKDSKIKVPKKPIATTETSVSIKRKSPEPSPEVEESNQKSNGRKERNQQRAGLFQTNRKLERQKKSAKEKLEKSDSRYHEMKSMLKQTMMQLKSLRDKKRKEMSQSSTSSCQSDSEAEGSKEVPEQITQAEIYLEKVVNMIQEAAKRPLAIMDAQPELTLEIMKPVLSHWEEQMLICARLSKEMEGTEECSSDGDVEFFQIPCAADPVPTTSIASSSAGGIDVEARIRAERILREEEKEKEEKEKVRAIIQKIGSLTQHQQMQACVVAANIHEASVQGTLTRNLLHHFVFSLLRIAHNHSMDAEATDVNISL